MDVTQIKDSLKAPVLLYNTAAITEAVSMIKLDTRGSGSSLQKEARQYGSATDVAEEGTIRSAMSGSKRSTSAISKAVSWRAETNYDDF